MYQALAGLEESHETLRISTSKEGKEEQTEKSAARRFASPTNDCMPTSDSVTRRTGKSTCTRGSSLDRSAAWVSSFGHVEWHTRSPHSWIGDLATGEDSSGRNPARWEWNEKAKGGLHLRRFATLKSSCSRPGGWKYFMVFQSLKRSSCPFTLHSDL